VVVVEPLVLPAGADVNVGGKPNAAANAGADVDEAGTWGEDDTPFGTLEEHYRMGCHNLPLLTLLVGVDCIIHDDSIANKL
jgi:hypothetical protein